jgi:hypothetical protein
MKHALLLSLLLAAPALAQGDIEARLSACMGPIDTDAIGARAEAFGAERDYEARLAALCAAGDEAGALAFSRETEGAFYAGDPEAARMRACLVEVLGEAAVATDTACEE